MQIDLSVLRKRGAQAIRRRPIRFALLLILLLLFLLIRMSGSLRPVATVMAVSKVQNRATEAINAAVEQEVLREGISYASLIGFEKSGDGSVTAVYTDIEKLNRLKTAVTERVLAQITAMPQGEISIPLGNILNSDLLSGRGPRLPVRILPMGNVSARVENCFDSAGINQTRHRIMLSVRAELCVLIGGYSADTCVTEDVCIAETVIVGAVPESYTLITDGELFEKYEDYLHD